MIGHGMIGVGQWALIGGVHCMTAVIAVNLQLSADTSSSRPEKSRALGAETSAGGLGLG